MASLRISFYTIVKVRTWQIQKKVIVLHFNPHHHEGGDSRSRSCPDGVLYFNPYHREGGDAFAMYRAPLLSNFNPHHREGGDLSLMG